MEKLCMFHNNDNYIVGRNRVINCYSHTYSILNIEFVPDKKLCSSKYLYGFWLDTYFTTRLKL